MLEKGLCKLHTADHIDSQQNFRNDHNRQVGQDLEEEAVKPGVETVYRKLTIQENNNK